MNRRWYLLGLAIIVASVLFQQPLLLVIGLLVLVVLGTTDIWSTYCLHYLQYSRQFSEQRVLFGEEITLALAVENAKLLPLPWLEVEDTIPRALSLSGQRLRVSLLGDTAVLDNLFSTRWYERVTRRYTIQCNVRGVHKFGPTVMRSGDVFGCFRTRRGSLVYVITSMAIACGACIGKRLRAPCRCRARSMRRPQPIPWSFF